MKTQKSIDSNSLPLLSWNPVGWSEAEGYLTGIDNIVLNVQKCTSQLEWLNDHSGERAAIERAYEAKDTNLLYLYARHLLCMKRDILYIAGICEPENLIIAHEANEERYEMCWKFQAFKIMEEIDYLKDDKKSPLLLYDSACTSMSHLEWLGAHTDIGCRLADSRNVYLNALQETTERFLKLLTDSELWYQRT
jgi:hypothetical protein